MSEAVGGAAAGEAEGGAPPSLHPRSFKLRFPAEREPGRSYVSAVKPLNLPSTVTGKFYAAERAGPGSGPGPGPGPVPEAALVRIRAAFTRGPRETHAAPLTTSHEYGWYASAAAPLWRSDRRLQHHLRDSCWLRARLALLADRPCR